MTQIRTALATGLERIFGRRQVVRASRFMLNHARRDGPNQIAFNGERLVQREALARGVGRAVVFDVGANLGQWSSHLIEQSSADLELHIFEPSAGCQKYLRNKLRSTNRITITFNQKAASSTDGEAMLFKPHEMAGSSSLHESLQGDGCESSHEAIRTCTLDTYCREHHIKHIDLLKIDAEGHDYHVLLGATGLLHRGVIEMVQFEYNFRWIGPRHYLKDVFDLVTPLGYRVGKVTPEGIEWYPSWSPQLETLIEANFVAARSTVAERLPAVRWWAETSKTGNSSAAKPAIRLAVLNSHPIQYFAPLYAYLNLDPDLEVTALYCTDFSLRGGSDPGFGRAVSWDVDLLAGYPAIFLGRNAAKRSPHGFWSLVCPEVWSEIRDGKYDAIVLHGYNYAATVIAFVAAKTKRLPVLMRSETHLRLRRSESKQRVRDAALAIAYHFVDGFLAIGTANRAYYRSLGVPDRKIFTVPYSVDNERFIAGANITGEERASIRQKYGLPIEGTVVLFASKLMRRKHPDDVIRAMAILRDKGHPAALFIVGTGEMEQELRDLKGALALDNVAFAGFVNQAAMPEIYAASDTFVLPSDNEPWGLVVNEVMCAGLPVVVSDEVGCVADLVKEGVNGYHIKAGDVLSLATALEKLVVDANRRKHMGSASRSIIDCWSYEQCRQGIAAAVAVVVQRPRNV